MKIRWEEKSHIASLLSRKYSEALNKAQDGSFESTLYLEALGHLYDKFKTRAGLFTKDMTGTEVDVDLTEKEEAIIWMLLRE